MMKIYGGRIESLNYPSETKICSSYYIIYVISESCQLVPKPLGNVIQLNYRDLICVGLIRDPP